MTKRGACKGSINLAKGRGTPSKKSDVLNQPKAMVKKTSVVKGFGNNLVASATEEVLLSSDGLGKLNNIATELIEQDKIKVSKKLIASLKQNIKMSPI